MLVPTGTNPSMHQCTTEKKYCKNFKKFQVSRTYVKLDAISSPSTYPCQRVSQAVSQWVSDFKVDEEEELLLKENFDCRFSRDDSIGEVHLPLCQVLISTTRCSPYLTPPGYHPISSNPDQSNPIQYNPPTYSTTRPQCYIRLRRILF